MDAKEIAGLLLDAKALAFNVKEPFTFASGIKSPVYMDCRVLISDVNRRESIIEALTQETKNANAQLIAATASAGIPWGAWVADRLKLPMVYVRQNAKDHGKGKKIEGNPKKGSKAVVIEDLVSTGGSSIATVNSLKEGGIEVTDCVAIFKYGFIEAENAFNKEAVRLHTLSNFNAAIEEAVKRRYLSLEDSTEAKKWIEDPKRWRT